MTKLDWQNAERATRSPYKRRRYGASRGLGSTLVPSLNSALLHRECTCGRALIDEDQDDCYIYCRCGRKTWWPVDIPSWF